mgnify:CR=1 FL=1
MTPAASSSPQRMDRRIAIKWMMTAAASTALLESTTLLAQNSAGAGSKPATGYGTDPDLLKSYRPGELWPLTFNEAQRATAAALCDTIIPEDADGPSASSLKVQDFIDEWISAPYPEHAAENRTIIDGLAWLDAESQKRFRKDFVKLAANERNAICDDICSGSKAKPALARGAQFFRKFRDLAAGGYYTTPEGMKAIGYVGNVALAKFEGPPPEVLQRLGLA